MRASALYNQLLKPSNVAKLADQYRFRGHLGDQDFFTMIGMEHPELFFSLACGWNRQLCTWWRDHGYGDVFQLYYRCDGPVYIYHGNCNSAIPDDWCMRCSPAATRSLSHLQYCLKGITSRDCWEDCDFHSSFPLLNLEPWSQTESPAGQGATEGPSCTYNGQGVILEQGNSSALQQAAAVAFLQVQRWWNTVK